MKNISNINAARGFKHSREICNRSSSLDRFDTNKNSKICLCKHQKFFRKFLSVLRNP